LPNVAFAFDTADAAVVGVSVYDATGTNLVWNTTGTNTGPGTFTTYWDLKDNYGNPIPMPGVDQSTMYNVSVTTTPLEAGPLAIPMAKGAGSGSSRFFSFSINNDDPYAGHAAVFRNLWSLWVDIPLGVNSVEAGVAQGPIAAITTSYVMHSVDPDGYDRSMNSTASPFVFKADEDMPYFYNVITNQATGHIIYICDASPYEFGSSVGYTCMSGSFGFVDVARTLGNPINSVRPLAFEWGHRVRYAEIDGCKSAVLSAAGCSFGSPASLDHYQMTKSAYVGWRTMRWSSVYWWPFNSASDYQIKYLHDYWTDMGQDTGIPLRTAGNECFDDVGANVYWKNSWTVQGSPGLTWWKKD
jgi:hypothetical protein